MSSQLLYFILLTNEKHELFNSVALDRQRDLGAWVEMG